MPSLLSFGSIRARVQNVLASVFNLYPLGGTSGGIIVRQKGGTPGTNEVQIYEDGTNTYIVPKQGALLVTRSADGAASLVVDGNNSATKITAGTLTFNTGATLGTISTGFNNLVAGVIGMYNSTGNGGWLQNTSGRSRLTADVTNATATMANLSDLSITLKAGRKYFGQYTFFAADATGADGLAFDLNGGSATFTSLEFGFAAQPAGSTLGVVTSTSAGTAVTLTVVSTSDAVYTVSFGIVCNAAGTLIPRFSKASGSTGNATVRLNSSCLIEDSPN